MNLSPHIGWWRPTASSGGRGWGGTLAFSGPGSAGSAVAFSALVAFTVILLMAPQFIFPVLATLRIALLAAAVAVMAHVFHRFTRHQPVMKFTREMRIAAILAAWAVVTVPLSYWPGGSVSFLLDLYFKTLVVFWLLCNLVTTLARLKLIAWALTLMSVPLAVTGIRNFLGGVFMQEAAGHGTTRIAGYEAPLTGNPNDLALMLNMILPLGIGLLLGTRKPAVRTLLLAVIGLAAIAVITTFSRAGFLFLAMTFGAYLRALLKRGERSWACGMCVLALAAAPFFPPSYIERLSTIAEIESDPTGSAQNRWADSIAAVRYTLRNPLIGAGVGMNTLAMNEARGNAWVEVHNVYLEHAVELGLPGLILFVMLLKGCLSGIGAVQRQSAQRPELMELFCLAEGIRISLLGFVVAAFFHPVAYHFYFYYFAGLAVAAKAVLEMEERGLTLGAASSAPARRVL